MRIVPLGFALLFSLVASLSTWLEPWFQVWAASRAKSGDLLSVALGDSRRLFARHIYAKADAYFHRGYYPSIFDGRPESGEMHMAAGATGERHREEVDFQGKPRDWIEAFGRHFYPSEHTHLGEGHDACCDHEHEHGEKCEHEHGAECDHDESSGGAQRELLPWLKLAAMLDPEMPESYVVAAYWLRSHLGKVDEAEKFLRDGLRSNPQNPEMLFELGRIFKENRNDVVRARNVWEIGVQSWEKTEGTKREPYVLVYAQLLGNLAKLEEEQKNYDRAIEHLNSLVKVSSNKAHLEKWIAELSAAKAK